MTDLPVTSIALLPLFQNSFGPLARESVGNTWPIFYSESA